jgi:hypothetical protein
MDMQQSNITVSSDGFIGINDRRVKAFDPDKEDLEFVTMTWRPNIGAKMPGYIARKKGDSHGFSQFEPFQRFIALFDRAAALEDAQVEKSLEDEKARQAEAQAILDADAEEQKAIEAFNDKVRPYWNIVKLLNAADHEVIKAVEQLLIDQGRLTLEFVHARDALRADARRLKQQLRAEGIWKD